MSDWKRWITVGALAAVMAVAMVWQVGSAGLQIGSCCPGCECPAVLDPVLCEDGNVYPNACIASLSCVGGCVRVGGPIE